MLAYRYNEGEEKNMEVLVVSKKTNLELHGEKIRKNVLHQAVAKNYLEALKHEHREHYHNLDRLFVLLKDYKIPYAKVNRGLFWPDMNKMTVVGNMDDFRLRLAINLQEV